MTCSLSWYRRNEAGKRVQIEFHLVRNKASWTVHRERNEPREPHEPDAGDWEALLDNLERNLRRGKVYPADVRIIKDLKKSWEES